MGNWRLFIFNEDVGLDRFSYFVVYSLSSLSLIYILSSLMPEFEDVTSFYEGLDKKLTFFTRDTLWRLFNSRIDEEWFTWTNPSSKIWNLILEEKKQNNFNCTYQYLFDQLYCELKAFFSYRANIIIDHRYFSTLEYFCKTLAYHRNYEGLIFAFTQGDEIFHYIDDYWEPTHTSVIIKSLRNQSTFYSDFLAQPFFCSHWREYSLVNNDIIFNRSHFLLNDFVRFITYEIWGYKDTCNMHISKEALLYINDLVKTKKDQYPLLNEYFMYRAEEINQINPKSFRSFSFRFMADISRITWHSEYIREFVGGMLCGTLICSGMEINKSLFKMSIDSL